MQIIDKHPSDIVIVTILDQETIPPKNINTNPPEPYTLVFLLNKTPSSEWRLYFQIAWDDFKNKFKQRHPDLPVPEAKVYRLSSRDMIVVENTTIEDFKNTIRTSLIYAIKRVNNKMKEMKGELDWADEAKQSFLQEIKAVAETIEFTDKEQLPNGLSFGDKLEIPPN